MAKVGNWTIENCSTVGGGDLQLTGTEPSGTRFRDSIPAGDVWYSISDGNNREAGQGNFNGTSTIVRNSIRATLVNDVFNDVNPTPISLTGDAVVACTFNAAAYDELTAHLDDTSGNPHNVQAIEIPYDSTTDPVTSLTNVQDAMLDHADSIEERIASASGIIEGGFLTSLNPTQFSISDGKGEIFNSYTNPENTSVTEIAWSGLSNIILDFGLEPVGSTDIYVNSVGNVLQIPGKSIGVNYRDNIFLGVIYHLNGVITEVTNAPSVIKQTATDVMDNLRRNINLSGVQITAVDALLQVYHREGQFFYPGINWSVDRTNPNVQMVVQEGDNLTGSPFYTLTQDGTLSLGTTLTIPEDYNASGGTLTPLGGNDATIHRMYSSGVGELVGDRQFILLYGQMNYVTTQAAKDNLIIDDSQTTFPSTIDDLFFLGYVCVRNNAGDFSDFNRAWISNFSSGSSSSSGIGGDHTGLSNRDAVDQHPIESIGVNAGEQLRETLDGKMKWRNTWQTIAYDPNDVVRDGDWTMVANKATTDRPAPQPSGEPQHVVTDAASENFIIGSDLSFITVTYTFTMNVSGWLQGIRIYVPFFDSETVTRVEITDDQSDVTTIIDDPLLIAGQWVTVHNLNQIAVAGDTGSINLSYFNGNSVNDINGGWNSFLGAGDPALSEFRLDNLSNPTVMTIDHTDLDSVNRDLELDGVSVDSLIQLTETGDVSRNIELKVTLVDIAPIDYTIYNVIVVSNGAKNIRSGKTCTVKISIPIAQASEYVFLPNHFPANPPWATISSEIAFDGVPQLGTSTTAYGVDLVFQEASVSLDWEFLALSSGGGGGGGSGGDLTFYGTVPPNPSTYKRWWDTETGRAYVYYSDPDSDQWVEEDPAFTQDLTIPDDSIGTVKIQDNAITNPKMADNSVGTLEIQDNAVTDVKMATQKASISGDTFTGTVRVEDVPGKDILLQNTPRITFNAATVSNPTFLDFNSANIRHTVRHLDLSESVRYDLTLGAGDPYYDFRIDNGSRFQIHDSYTQFLRSSGGNTSIEGGSIYCSTATSSPKTGRFLTLGHTSSNSETFISTSSGDYLELISDTGIRFPSVATTGSAANVFMDSGNFNQIMRSTSLRANKVDITPLDNAIDIINKLNPITYKPNLNICKSDYSATPSIGLIAEEVEIVFPGLTHGHGEDLSGVQYERIGVVAIQAIKELLGKIEVLENRICAIESEKN